MAKLKKEVESPRTPPPWVSSKEGQGVHPPTPEKKKTGTSKALQKSDPVPSNVITLRPQPGPQEEFLQSPEDEILFGGSKGGGKSFALMLAVLRYVHIPGYKGIIFRRTYPKLIELMDRAYQIFPHLGGRWQGKDYRWVFPSGASVKFAHCQNEEDKYIYQGHEYHVMCFDQVEEFTESQYMFLVTQMRNPPKGVDKQVLCTANPGGIGHAWVYRRFMVDPMTNEEVPPGHVIRQEFEMPFQIAGKNKGDRLIRSRVFIPATVYDNKIMLENDPNYLTNLMQLPEAERRALLEGDWHVFAGQYFKEWSNTRHVIPPFEIPSNWLRYRCMDFGSTAPTALYDCAVDEQGTVFVYREYYAAGYTAKQHAKRILEATPEGERFAFFAVDAAIFSHDGHEYTIAEQMMEEGLNGLEPTGKNRISGWQELSWRLSFNDATGKQPGIYFFSTCINAIRTIPGLIHDPRNPEDLNSDGEDHAADAIRYGLVRLKDMTAKPMESVRENQSGFRFGIPIKVWQQSESQSGYNPWRHIGR